MNDHIWEHYLNSLKQNFAELLNRADTPARCGRMEREAVAMVRSAIARKIDLESGKTPSELEVTVPPHLGLNEAPK